MIRRFGESPEPGRKYTRRVGVYALLPRAGHLLLTCQTEPGPDLQLPGGGIDQGESPATALHREVFEETGWLIAAPRRVGAFRRFTYMPEYDLWAEKICHIFFARPTIQIGPPLEAGHTAIWTSFEAAADLVANDGDQMFIEKAFASLR